MKILKIFLVLISLSIFLNADDDHHKEHKYKSLDYLDLDKSQVKELKEILIEFKYKYHDFHEIKEDKEKELKSIMKEKSFDKEKYIKIHKEINEKAAILEANKMKKIHEILTPHQRIKFSRYLEEWEID